MARPHLTRTTEIIIKIKDNFRIIAEDEVCKLSNDYTCNDKQQRKTIGTTLKLILYHFLNPKAVSNI